MKISFNTKDPIYVQVIQYFKEQIAKGLLEPGEEIPSRRELANHLKINPNTVQRAYKEMEEQALIYTERNLPSRITKDEHILKSVREELILDAVDSFISSIRTIDVPLEDVLELVKKTYDEKDQTYEVDIIIEVKHIKKTFGRNKVLKDVSFTANKGEITCLIGVNGVGKTTVLNGIMKLTPFNGGQVLMNGKPIT